MLPTPLNLSHILLATKSAEDAAHVNEHPGDGGGIPGAARSPGR
jgi:hypothetical protein